MFVWIKLIPAAFKAFVLMALAVQALLFNVVPELQLVYNAVPAITEGSPTKPYKLFNAPDEVVV